MEKEGVVAGGWGPFARTAGAESRVAEGRLSAWSLLLMAVMVMAVTAADAWAWLSMAMVTLTSTPPAARRDAEAAVAARRLPDALAETVTCASVDLVTIEQRKMRIVCIY